MPLKGLRFAMLVAALLAAMDARAHRRALLIGINDYSASRIGARPHTLPAPGRDWPTLSGAANDAKAFGEMLTLLYGFEQKDILTITDQAATRTAILEAIDRQLVQPAAKGDVVVFYFAGHGSQVRNSRSDEPDRLDESIVPADSRIGAADIRDKELQALFNRVLDRGAHLTIILDNCHSGSGARGLLTGAQPRGVSADLRDVADGSRAPYPEARGALVLSAAQDFDSAFETRDMNGAMHGAFTWALMRAMRDSAPGESGGDVFLRAQARLQSETPFQEPVLAGTPQARRRAFLGEGEAHHDHRTKIAVETVRRDGTVIVQGGWAHGLAVGSELRGANAIVVITAVRGLGQSEGRLRSGTVASGALLELAGWAAPPARPLRVWIPQTTTAMDSVARTFASAAKQRGIRWVTDPIEGAPTHVLRRGAKDWELLDRSGVVANGDDAMAHVPAGASLFVQFPAPASLAESLVSEGVERAARAEDADYILAGRYASHQLTYAWVRPLIAKSDARKTGLPLRSDWSANAETLRDAVLRLRRIQAWHLLESPREVRAPYRLALRGVDARDVVRDRTLRGGNTYELVLRASPEPRRARKRAVYVFVIDSFGRSVLLFPREGPVENRFPLAAHREDVALGRASQFEIVPPYGVDTYFLLTTDEPLPDPSVLEWSGVRTRSASSTALEELLASVGTRGAAPVITPMTWSLEKVVIESMP